MSVTSQASAAAGLVREHTLLAELQLSILATGFCGDALPFS
jgi:hypothetical protein